MDDDWRLQIDFEEQQHSARLLKRLAAELEHDLSTEYGDRMAVSRAGERVFVYAGSREQSEGSRALIERLAGEHGWSIETDLKRWHPIAEEWEDPDKPVPDGQAAVTAEHEELMATERREAAQRGNPEFEVRIQLQTRHEAVRLDKELRAEGIPTVRRFNFLLLGATDEDSAKTMAEELRSDVPAEAAISVEGTWQMAFAESRPNPFAIFGL
jgi:hypothetical protein